MDVVKTLDTKGTLCPEPILMIKAAMGEINTGEIIEMQATDAGSVSDMASWSKRTGNKIVDQKEENGVFTFFVEKK
ncbi:MAG: sulfurtransferase TusA family protein [Nitrospinota bacterium]